MGLFSTLCSSGTGTETCINLLIANIRSKIEFLFFSSQLNQKGEREKQPSAAMTTLPLPVLLLWSK